MVIIRQTGLLVRLFEFLKFLYKDNLALKAVIFQKADYATNFDWDIVAKV